MRKNIIIFVALDPVFGHHYVEKVKYELWRHHLSNQSINTYLTYAKSMPEY